MTEVSSKNTLHLQSLIASFAFVTQVVFCVGCGARPDYLRVLEEDGIHHSAYPVDLPHCVQTPKGCLPLDDVYIAGVLECELGGLTDSAAALEAQAIAARTFVTRYLTQHGFDTEVRIGPRFQCWKPPKKARSVKVARATKGNVILWNGKLIVANYVAGTRQLDQRCEAESPRASGYPFSSWQELLVAKKKRKGRLVGVNGTDWTEIYVTRNEGLSGVSVQPTPMGARIDINRGALSQNAAACLGEKKGYETRDILTYFYGKDITLTQALPYESTPKLTDSNVP